MLAETPPELAISAIGRGPPLCISSLREICLTPMTLTNRTSTSVHIAEYGGEEAADPIPAAPGMRWRWDDSNHGGNFTHPLPTFSGYLGRNGILYNNAIMLIGVSRHFSVMEHIARRHGMGALLGGVAPVRDAVGRQAQSVETPIHPHAARGRGGWGIGHNKPGWRRHQNPSGARLPARGTGNNAGRRRVLRLLVLPRRRSRCSSPALDAIQNRSSPWLDLRS